MNVQLKIISKYIEALKSTNQIAKFNSIARRYLDSGIFTNEGIRDTYGMSRDSYLKLCCDDYSSSSNPKVLLSNHFSQNTLDSFIKGLDAERQQNRLLNDALAHIEKKEQDEKDEEGEKKLVETREVEEKIIKDKEVVVSPKSVNAGIKFEVDVASILIDAAKNYLSSDAAGILTRVDERIKEEALKLRPTQIIIGAREPVTMKGKTHACFNALVETLEYEKQAFLVGPAGTGKTTLASQVSKVFKVPFGHISCTAGMSEAHLLGRMIADGRYISSEFVELYENGGVFLFDEVDAADPNTLLIINSALANGYLSLPNRAEKPKAFRHKEFYAVCAANTFGNGSNQYAGRSILDAAFLDRFCMAKLEVPYDKELEKDILAEFTVFASKLWKIRQNIETVKLRRILSTRVFASSAVHLKSGKTPEQILARFFTGWSHEEKSKALQGT